MLSDDDDRISNRFAGEGDSVVQAGAIHGGVHFHGRKRVTVPPRQLPAGVAGFVNRESDLEQLDTLLSSLSGELDRPRSPTVVISAIAGAPGVGKTALALHWAHLTRHNFPDGDLYLDMRAYGAGIALSVEQALSYFLRSLNVDPVHIPADLDECAALYRSILGDKKMLIVIDNVATVRQLRHLLPGSRSCLTLVTSRNRLSSLVAREGATRVTLDVLSPEESIQLLAEIIGDGRVESDYEAAGRVAEACSFLPLALRVVAERAASRPYLSLAELVNELAGEQRRLDVLTSEEDELTDVRAVFSWSYRALSPEQQKVFRLLGLHAGTEFSSAVAAALVGVSVDTVLNQLQQLAGVHLLQEIAPERYRLHDLLRAYSVERGLREEPQRERTHAIRRMLSWYLLTADMARKVILPYSHSIPLVPVVGLTVRSFDGIDEAMDWYEKERVNLLAALRQAMDLGQYDIAWKLPVVADGFFELRSYWVEWKQIHHDGLVAAQAVGDRLGEASNLLCLGDVNWRSGEYETAAQQYEHATAVAGTITDRWLEGFSLRGSGLVHSELGNLGEAIDYFNRALGVFRSSGIMRGEGMALLSLGKSYRTLGDLRYASEYCESAVGIFREINDLWSQAWGLMPLGEVYQEMDQLEVSGSTFSEALTIFRDFKDIRSEALALDRLASTFYCRGDSIGARECWLDALEIFELLGDPHADEIRERIESMA